MEEEIDLRVYIELLVRRWLWLVGLGLTGAIVALVVSLLMTPTFESESQVLIIKSETDISFEPRIKSETVESTVNSDRKADRDAITSLVRSNEVAGMVLNQVRDQLPEKAQALPKLLKKVNVENDGNLILIKVQDPDPELAAEIANLWATSFETYINKLFNEQKGDLLVQVRSQLEDVEFEYKQSQVELEAFLAANQIMILNRSISNLTKKLDSQYDLLSAKYEELNLLEALLEDVYAVQDQITQGTTSYGAKLGDMMAMTNLRNNSSSLAMRTRTVQNGTSSAVGQASRIDLQINGLPVDVTEVATLDETTSLIQAIEARQARVETEIEELSTALLEPDSQLAIKVSVSDSQPIHDLIDRIQILQSRAEAQNTEARELQEARDQAWENYKSMQRKLAEVQLGSQITDSVVRTADYAVVALKPVSPRLLLNTLIGGVLGGILALIAIFGESFWQGDSKVAQTDT